MRKFPNQAKLLKIARAKTQLSQFEFGAVIGLPGTQLISDIERGTKPLTIPRWRLLEPILGKQKIVKALVADYLLKIEQDYEGAV